MEQSKSFFVISYNEDYAYEGNRKDIILSRLTTKEEIEKEVEHLNKTVTTVKNDENCHFYFSFEEVNVLKTGYGKSFCFPSSDPSLNIVGLTNFIRKNFDTKVNNFKKESEKSNNTFKESIEGDGYYMRFMENGAFFADVMEIAQKLFDNGEIVSNPEILKNKDVDLKKVLGKKFKIK